MLRMLLLFFLKMSYNGHSSQMTRNKSSLAHFVCLIALTPSCNMLAYPNKMKNQYMSPIFPIFAGQLTLTP